MAKGSAEIINCIGMLYENNRTIGDVKKAVNYYQQAAELG